MTPLDPGGHIVDYLRSCYSTTMILDKQGNAYPVDWYFVPSTNLLLGPTVFSSLNYIRPTVPPGILGEVPNAVRKWRNGGRPSYLGPRVQYPVTGTPDQFVNGADGPSPAAQSINFLGQRRLSNIYPPGIFPTPPTGSGAVTMTWPGNTVIPGSFTPGLEYNWTTTGLAFTLAGVFDLGLGGTPFWTCYPAKWTFCVSNDNRVTLKPLRCISWDGVGTSLWTDPVWGLVTGTITLTY